MTTPPIGKYIGYAANPRQAWWALYLPPDLEVPDGITVRQEADGYIEVRSKHAIISVEARPTHCDRGRYVAKLFNDGSFNIEPVDGWSVGRYYMTLERGLPEIIEWLADRESRVRG